MHVLQSVWKDAVNDTEPRETIFNQVNINSASVGWQVFAYLFFRRTAFKIRIFFLPWYRAVVHFMCQEVVRL